MAQVETSGRDPITISEATERLFIERVKTRFEEISQLVSAVQEALPAIQENPGLVAALPQVLTDISELTSQTLAMIENRMARKEIAPPFLEEKPEVEMREERLLVLTKERVAQIAEQEGVSQAVVKEIPPERLPSGIKHSALIEKPETTPETPVLAEEVSLEEEVPEKEEKSLEELFQELDEETQERAHSWLEGKERLRVVEDFAEFLGVNNESARRYLIKLCDQLGIETLSEGKMRRKFDFSPSTAVRLLIEMQNNPPVKRHRKKLPPPSELSPAEGEEVIRREPDLEPVVASLVPFRGPEGVSAEVTPMSRPEISVLPVELSPKGRLVDLPSVKAVPEETLGFTLGTVVVYPGEGVLLLGPGEPTPVREAPGLIEEAPLPELTSTDIEAIKARNITLESLLEHLEERIDISPQVSKDLRNTLQNEENRRYGMRRFLETCLGVFIDRKGGQERVSATEASLLGLVLARRSGLFFQGVVEHKLLKALERIKGPQGRPEVIRKPGFSKRQLAGELFQEVNARAEQVRAIESKAQLVASLGNLNQEVFWEIDKELEKIAAEEINVFSPPFLKFVAGISISPAEGCYLSLYRKEGGDYVVGDGMKAYETFRWAPEDDIPYSNTELKS